MTTRIETATGAELDKLGASVGVPRKTKKHPWGWDMPESDQEYSPRILAAMPRGADGNVLHVGDRVMFGAGDARIVVGLRPGNCVDVVTDDTSHHRMNRQSADNYRLADPSCAKCGELAARGAKLNAERVCAKCVEPHAGKAIYPVESEQTKCEACGGSGGLTKTIHCGGIGDTFLCEGCDGLFMRAMGINPTKALEEIASRIRANRAAKKWTLEIDAIAHSKADRKHDAIIKRCAEAMNKEASKMIGESEPESAAMNSVIERLSSVLNVPNLISAAQAKELYGAGSVAHMAMREHEARPAAPAKPAEIFGETLLERQVMMIQLHGEWVDATPYNQFCAAVERHLEPGLPKGCRVVTDVQHEVQCTLRGEHELTVPSLYNVWILDENGQQIGKAGFPCHEPAKHMLECEAEEACITWARNRDRKKARIGKRAPPAVQGFEEWVESFTGKARA